MTRTPLRVVFMGTPEFAVPVLESLLAAEEVVAVVTNPDRPAGRGKVATPPPVKVAAQAAGVPVLQPTKIKTGAFQAEIEALRADVGVVVAYGRILPQGVLDAPRLGCLNVHASLLPELRGAAPIQWAVARGHKVSGVSIMQMEAGLDTGPVYHTVSVTLGPRETGGGLHDRLSRLGPVALAHVLDALREGGAVAQPQNHDLSTYAPLMAREDGDLDWRQPAEELDRRVRGFSPWPGAWTTITQSADPRLQDLRLKILAAAPWAEALPEGALEGAAPGQVCCARHGLLLVQTGQGALSLLECQAPGRKALLAAEFLRGCEIPQGAQLARTS
jgi:methionyl-tRNA formyltransferase